MSKQSLFAVIGNVLEGDYVAGFSFVENDLRFFRREIVEISFQSRRGVFSFRCGLGRIVLFIVLGERPATEEA